MSGFTIIRNAVAMGYPIVQSIRSLLPLVDEFVIGVGQSDDQTKELIHSIGDPKIKIFDSHWDTSKTTGGLILSEKTNEALERCSNDWCFYLQADEVVHEGDLPLIRKALADHENDPSVQGLLFHYVHFYGSYSVIATARNWYRNEVRVVKKSSGARSVGDAQSFRIFGSNNSGGVKPRVKRAGGGPA
ncbi:MAG: glycosyltransferase, partial [Bdellovibrionia bacterium]